MASTNYDATSSLVASNTTNLASIVADTKIGVHQPWLASGNQGNPNISTTLASEVVAGSSTLVLASNGGFPASYPSVFQSGISYLPPQLGRLAGDLAIGSTSLPMVISGEMPQAFPFFIRLGNEVLQVTGTSATIGTLVLAVATTAFHPDFTPIHLNAMPTNVKYRAIDVPNFYLTGQASPITGTLTNNVIQLSSTATTIGTGQTITGSGVPSSTTVSSHTNSNVTLSTNVTAFSSGATFTNKYTFSNVGSSAYTYLANLTSFSGGSSPTISTLPQNGALIAGTGIPTTTYYSVDPSNLALSINNAPTALGTPSLTSTLTFTATTTATNVTVTLVSVTVNGTSYPKVGTTNPTWNGSSLNYYIKVGAPITTASAGGIAGRNVATVNNSAGTFTVSGTTGGITAAVGATITSAILFTASVGYTVGISPSGTTELDKLLAVGSSVTGTYIGSSATITSVISAGFYVLSAVCTTATPWTSDSPVVSQTFTGSVFANNKIYSVSPTTGLKVGGTITGTYIPNNTTITAINGSTITLSNTLTNISVLTAQSFYLGANLRIGNSYTQLQTTPLPCYLPSGTTLNIMFGDFKQTLTTSANANAGATTISINSFTPRYNYSPTYYKNGVALNLDGSYSRGAIIGVGLANDIAPNQILILSANASTANSLEIITNAYVRKDTVTIPVTPFTSTYAYDGQGVGFSFTASTTSNNNQITTSGSVSGLSVGQQVFSSVLTTNISYFVTAVSGTTVTLSANIATTNASVSFSVYSTSFVTSYPMTLDTGSVQETVYPISLPVSTNGYFTINLSAPTNYAHKSGSNLSYYAYPTSLQVGDTTYRNDLGKFLMFDGTQWRTARVNNLRGVFSILGAVGGGDISNISFLDPITGKESVHDTFKGTSSTGFTTYFGGQRNTDPNGLEWTSATISNLLLHFKVTVPQGKSVAFRSVAVRSEFKASALASSIHFSPGDNFEIAPDITNSVYWSYSDLEGDVQTGWQVSIFDDYTYNLPTFDPSSSTPFWTSSGNDDSAEIDVTATTGWVNGQKYWAFVRVAKQFQNKQWWGDWNSQSFTANVDQPSLPIMSVFADNTNAVNQLVIQSTDNLLGENNGSFANGLGQWAKGSLDTTNTTVKSLIDGISLSQALTSGTTISSIAVGATGYVITQGALSGTGTGTFKVSAKANGGADALGFPTSGQFWVTIGTERILVTNNMDGNSSGDTFTIITRGYQSTTAVSHAVGATVTYALQNDLYVGTTLTVDWQHQVTTNWSTTSTAVTRWSNGQGASVSPPTSILIPIETQTQGADKDTTDHVVVQDNAGVLSKKDVGSTVSLIFNHWYVAGGANTIISNIDGSQTVGTTTPTTLGIGVFGIPLFNAPHVDMVISGVQDIWDTSQSSNPIHLATVTKQVAGSQTQGKFIFQLSLNPNVQGSTITFKDSTGGNPTWKHIPSGTNLTLTAPNGIHDPIKNTNFVPPAMDITLTKDWHFTDKVMNIKPIGVGHGWQVGDGSSFIIPVGANVAFTPPVLFTGKKVVHFKGKYTDKKGYEKQKLQKGDSLSITKSRTGTTAVPATASGVYTRTVVTPHTSTTNTDSQQDLVVDFSTTPVIASSGTIGSLSGSTFTAYTSGSNSPTFNAMFFASNVGLSAGYDISAIGLLPNTSILAVTTVSGGYAVTFKNNAGATISGQTQYSSVVGSTGTAPDTTSAIVSGIDAVVTPATSNVVLAGSTSIPVKAFNPKWAFPQYTPVRIHYPTYFGDNSLIVDPTTGSGGSGDIAEVSTYPSDWVMTDQNPISVNAGITYGLAGFSKRATGTGYPTFTPRIDWYDEVGNLIKRSYGTESLNNAGTINTVSIGTPMNTTSGLWGDGWVPTAMVAVAPKNQTVATTLTFTSLTGSTGTFTTNGTGLLINLKAGTVLSNVSGTQFTVTNNVTAASGTVSIPVRFTNGLLITGTNTLSISATRAVCNFQWIGALASDAYALSGIMFKALTAPVYSNANTTSSTEIPKLATAVTVAPNLPVSAFPLPTTTPVVGVNSLYVFDPVGDYGTREIEYGGVLNALWTTTTSAVAIGDTAVTLASIAGIGAGTQITLEYQSGNSETVTVSSSWTGGNTLKIQAPGFTKAHNAKVSVYGLTAGLSNEISTTQSANTPVAVFNWGKDGYIGSSKGAYQYKVEKSEDSGITWTTLRNGGSLVADKTGMASITDYEAVAGLPTYYRATATFVADPTGTAYTVAGGTTQALLAPTLSNASWWIASTSDSTLRYPMLVKTGYTETQKHPSGVFYPLGSSRPITLAGVVQGRDGSITVTWIDNANFDNFLSLINKGETLILTNPVESDRKYIFINQDVSITHNAANSPYREFTINYVEAAPPNFGYTYGS